MIEQPRGISFAARDVDLDADHRAGDKLADLKLDVDAERRDLSPRPRR
jgi:hypothetical protein